MNKLLLFCVILIVSCTSEPVKSKSPELVIYTTNSKYTLKDLKVTIDNLETKTTDSILFDTEKERNEFIEKETFLNRK